jgi:hypothetical protein
MVYDPAAQPLLLDELNEAVTVWAQRWKLCTGIGDRDDNHGLRRRSAAVPRWTAWKSPD